MTHPKTLSGSNMANKSSENNTEQKDCNESKWTSQHGKLYKQLRNEWKIGSKCIVFSKTFKQWINTNIIKIENKNGEQILTVKNGGHYETISFERFSNNIQPIYISNSKSNNISNEWINLLNSNDINKSLYVTQNLFKNKENESRIKWDIGNILIIFDYQNEKWVKGKIINIFNENIEWKGYSWSDTTYTAESEWFCISYDNKKRNVQRFSNDIGPIYKNNIKNNNNIVQSIVCLYYLHYFLCIQSINIIYMFSLKKRVWKQLMKKLMKMKMKY